MSKFSFLRNVAIIACLAVMTACGGGSKQQNQAATSGNTEKAASAKGNALFDIPKDKIQTYRNGDGTDLALALSEIPSGIFKGVGELNTAHIMLSKYGLFKYDVVLHFKVKSGKDAVKTLTDYYKTIGATVTEEGSDLITYKVTFGDWGQSIDFTGISADAEYLNLQLNVVKK